MKRTTTLRLGSITIVIAIASCLGLRAFAQGMPSDYERANGLKARYEAAAIDIAGAATWLGNTW